MFVSLKRHRKVKVNLPFISSKAFAYSTKPSNLFFSNLKDFGDNPCYAKSHFLFIIFFVCKFAGQR